MRASEPSGVRRQESPPGAADSAPEFRALFQAGFDYVWHTLRRLGVPARDLADVTHDVFERVYRSFAQYERARPLKPWLFGFAFRVAADYRRLARNRYERLTLLEEPAGAQPTPVEALLHAERLELAMLALEGIEFERRAVFVLHELDGYPIPEVADALGIDVNTAYSRLRLARREFERAAQRLRSRRGEL